MTKVSDYIINFLVRKGINDIFMIAGGGIIHLMESVASNKKMNYFCNYNEQATTYSAEGYARLKNKISACLVTSGPGSTNALSGVASAWVDSVPMIVISGQVKKELIADYAKLRQIGEQEIDIIDMAKPVTKYAKTISNPAMIRRELEAAFYAAISGRPGPVWLNIPVDIQGSFIDERELSVFKPKKHARFKKGALLKQQVGKTIKLLKESRRPLILCGFGIRLGKGEKLLKQLLVKCRLPVLLSFNGMDLLAEDHPLFVGKPGIIGQRRANFAIQNCDCLLTIGSRLNIKIVGYNYKDFAPKAKKIMVDIDAGELNKPTVSCDLAVCADAREFLEEFLKQVKGCDFSVSQDWFNACENWKRRYPNVDRKSFQRKGYVNTYVFYDKLSDLLTKDDIVVSGNGLAALALYQAFKVKQGQRVFTNNGYGAMGWGLPAGIGACIANNRKQTICVTGDGSIQMNIQELELVKYHKLPIKIFVLNNAGYTSIRLTQNTFFKGHYVGADRASGVGNPDFKKIAMAYKLNYLRISSDKELKGKIKKVLSNKEPVLCELNVSARQGIIPKVTSYKSKDGSFQSRPLEDMFPFLSRKELRENMRISSED